LDPNKEKNIFDNWHREGLITAIAFGGFLIIVGFLFVLTPNLWQDIVYFFNHITTRSVPVGGLNSNIVLPAPSNPAVHANLYRALLKFDLAFGVLQILILFVRLIAKSKIRRIAETLGNAVFWLGAAFLVNSFLLTGTLSGWFQYWAALIVVVGISLVARSIVYLFKRK
jgi:hypothetical protein